MLSPLYHNLLNSKYADYILIIKNVTLLLATVEVVDLNDGGIVKGVGCDSYFEGVCSVLCVMCYVCGS